MDLLFRTLKKHLADKRVATDADVKRAVTKIATDTSNAERNALVPQWDDCFNTNGQYVEVRHIPGVLISH
jgi:hypothetical protein